MKTIAYSVTYIGYVEVSDAASEEEIEKSIMVDVYGNEPNDVEWEKVR